MISCILISTLNRFEFHFFTTFLTESAHRTQGNTLIFCFIFLSPKNIQNAAKLEAANIVEAFEFFGEIVFEQNRISSKFDRFQWHRSIYSRESIDALGPFNHMIDIGRQHFRICAFGTLELLAWNDLNRWFSGDVCH